MRPEALTAAMEVLSGLSTLATALIAAYGLFTWRMQYRAQVNFELARNLSRSSNKVVAAIRRLRVAVSFVIESKSEDSNQTESEERHYQAKLRTILNQDYTAYKQAKADLEDAVREAEMVWGGKSLLFNMMILSFMSIDNDIEMVIYHLKHNSDDRSEESKREDEELVQKVTRTYDKDDPFGKEIEKAVQGIKAIADPHLKL